ncbi:MAG: acyl-CoA dehydrogenase [Alphaproteobacteria bacterium]|nr:acyl-CoA dehydrogenase [Alphaproteobacteria bacterium]
MLFDKTIMKIAQGRAAKISPSQRVALEAGDALVERSLFAGNPDWKTVLEMEEQRLTDAEQSFIDNEVTQLCEMLEEWGNHHSEEEDIPEQAWQFMKDNKFFGMVLPKEYGGLGFGAKAHAVVIEKLVSVSLPAAVVAMVPNSLGPGELLMHHGTQLQKDTWLPRLASGEVVPCFGLTEPEAGSDALNVQSTGEVFKDDDRKIKIRINAEKRYITLAPKADLIGLAVQLRDPQNLLGKGENPGITTVLVSADAEGVQSGLRHRPEGGAFRNGPLKVKDAVISADKDSADYGIMGEPGKGWAMLMQNLGVGRAISIPSIGIGILKSLTRTTGAYADVRYQFGMAVSGFEGVQEPLAHMAADTYRVEAARRFALDYIDVEGKNPSGLSVIMKYWATEFARDAINKGGVDVESGKAVMKGPKNHVAKFYEALLISIVGEGSNVMMRNLLIFGQSAVKSHPYLLEEADAAATNNAKESGRLARKHGFQVAGNVAKSLLGRFAPTRVPEELRDSPLRSYAKDINRMTSMFSATSDACLMYLGGDIQRREAISARLGDALSHLYMAISTVRRFEKEGRQEGDLPLAEWAIKDSLHRAEQALVETVDNLPRRGLPKEHQGKAFHEFANRQGDGLVRAALRTAVLPWSRWQRKPSDTLTADVAKTITKPGDVRDRLTAGAYRPDLERSNSAEAQIERALLKVHETNGLEAIAQRAIRQAITEGELPRKGLSREQALEHIFNSCVIDSQQLARLQERDALRREAVAVDVFDEAGNLRTDEWMERPASGMF